jgi:hypothetical protein
MIVFTSNSEADAIAVATERSGSGRWHGVFRLAGSIVFTVHDVYPCAKGAKLIAASVNGKVTGA